MRIIKHSIFHKDFRVRLSLFGSAVLVLLLSAPHTLFADTSTLERIADAEREVSYIGVRLKTFISPRGTRSFEELIIHNAPEAPYAKELSVVGERKSFNGSRDDERGDDNRRDNRRRGRDRNDRNDNERSNEHTKWRQVRSLFSTEDIELIAQNYNLETSESTEKIANYDTDILTITPKFAGRATYRIFFARDNGVTLRTEALDPEGVLRAMSVYTRLSFDAVAVEKKWKIFQEEIKPEPERSYSISLVDGEKVLKTKPIQPEYMPPGFQLQDVHKIKDKEHTIHLIYTDGLLGFSIFETTEKHARRSSRQRSKPDMIDGTPVHKHQRGPTHAFSWSSGDIHFFLFGAMPASEMEKVVESIIHKSKKK